MKKRSGKFYYKNEKEVMNFLGLKTVPGSGSGWVHKEDGESDTVMVQLKSTDASSYKLDMLDLKKLEYHADVSNKVPIFLVQFLQQGRLYAVIEVGNINELFDAFTGTKTEKKKFVPVDTETKVERKSISSSKKSRDKFYEEREAKYGRKR